MRLFVMALGLALSLTLLSSVMALSHARRDDVRGAWLVYIAAPTVNANTQLYRAWLPSERGASLRPAQQLTHIREGRIIQPTASRDGRYLYFASNHEASDEIYQLDLRDLTTRRLTFNMAYDGQPAPSPDGEQIAFFSDRFGERGLYIMPSAGDPDTDAERLTDFAADVWSPRWFPDGERIAFQSNLNGDFELYTLHIPSDNLTRLTEHPAYDGLPALSPDGSQIAFVSDRIDNTRTNFNIYITSADIADVDSAARPLLAQGNSTIYSLPSWSPNGAWLSFASESPTPLMSSQISRVRPDGSGLQVLTPSGNFYAPRYAPLLERPWQPWGILAIAALSAFIGLYRFRRVAKLRRE